jgi:hypothetical protein
MPSTTTAPGRPAIAGPPPGAGATLRRLAREGLLVCGILSSLAYVAANVVSAMSWPGYSSWSQAISELSAIGAPSRSAWVPLGLLYDALLLAFAAGVWQSAGRRRDLRTTAILLVAIGVLGLLWPPMHLRGAPATLTDTMHITFAGVTSLIILLAVGVSARALGRGFRVYAIATFTALLLFGTVSFAYAPRLAANLPTPGMGFLERLNLGAYLLWVAVLAVALVREAHREVRSAARKSSSSTSPSSSTSSPGGAAPAGRSPRDVRERRA